MNKYLFLAVISLAAANNSVAKNSNSDIQCVSIDIPAFNLMPDENCAVSSDKLILSKLPDQVFVYDHTDWDPLNPTCFTIINGSTYQPEVTGKIQDLTSERVINITFSGVAGLTENNYPNPQPFTWPLSLSFTAATLVSIAADGGGGGGGATQHLGQLVTRDAGTIVIDLNDRSNDVATARMSVVKGTDIFKGVSGYIDEMGKEFKPDEPAKASGILCGKGLADELDDLVGWSE